MNIILSEVETIEGDPTHEQFSKMRSPQMAQIAAAVGDTQRIDISKAIDWNKNYSAVEQDKSTNSSR